MAAVCICYLHIQYVKCENISLFGVMTVFYGNFCVLSNAQLQFVAKAEVDLKERNYLAYFVIHIHAYVWDRKH